MSTHIDKCPVCDGVNTIERDTFEGTHGQQVTTAFCLACDEYHEEVEHE